LLGLPIFEAIGINYDVTLASALGDGVAAILAVVAGYGISRWQVFGSNSRRLRYCLCTCRMKRHSGGSGYLAVGPAGQKGT